VSCGFFNGLVFRHSPQLSTREQALAQEIWLASTAEFKMERGSVSRYE
jgi:hypothetical protein